MNTKRRINKTLAGILLVFIFAMAGGFTGTLPVHAAGGNVYTCVIHPCYAHPVTGVIEDSGGEAAYTTGQGMVEGAVSATGILELTDSGEYYLTIRMSLMDYTSGHSFWVQKVGDSDWTSPDIGVTGNGTDSNGTTADICMKVPSENCVVRGAMHVDPMGRDVIFYLYPSDYTVGNSTNMSATIVTESSEGNPSSADNDSRSTDGKGNSSVPGSGSLGSDSSQKNSPGLTAPGASDAAETSTDIKNPGLSSSITEAAKPETKNSATSTLGNSQGLSLSTAKDTTEAKEGSALCGNGAIAMGIAITISGLILLGAAAVMIYIFRKNWKRWGGGFADDEEE